MRSLLAAVVLMSLVSATAHASIEAQKALITSIPDGNALAFRAYLGDTELGTHKMRWSVSGETVVVNIEIDLRARVLLVPVYRYQHRSQETWTGGVLTAISTTTDDDGESFALTGALKGGVFEVKSKDLNGPAPLPLAPTSYWSYASLKAPHWISTQSGKLLKFSVAPKGIETINTKGGDVKASRYDVSGDLDVSLWYDERKRWVRSRFKVGDNVITYVKQ